MERMLVGLQKKMCFQVVFEWMQLGILGEFGACGT